ncbi:MAG: pyridoxine 5'-phosphate synthase [Phycisphaeraceae bacterium]|nr:pyridoxine 5'-phosphate synthase [Phycisphaeraceae bacterium]
MPTKLSVNVNKIALLRNTRDYGVPDVVAMARICLEAGAHGITVHPRPDQRHIRPGDVHDLSKLLEAYPDREFNIEGNPFEGPYMQLVEAVRPDQATLVPDTPGQRTSDHGWDVARERERLIPIVRKLRDWGVRVSLFMDPDVRAIEAVPATGADRVELYTEAYAAAFRRGRAEDELPKYVAAARRATELGLGVNAGHDLNQKNLTLFCRSLLDGGAEVLEVSIGHELTAEALVEGLSVTVGRYLDALARAGR